MIDDVDRLLADHLATLLPGTQLRFDAPTALCDADGPVVDIHLIGLEEVRDGLAAQPHDVRDDDGRVIARRPPARTYRLLYLATTWADDASTRHRLLGDLLLAVASDEPLQLRGRPATLQLADATNAVDLDAVAQLCRLAGIPARAGLRLVLQVAVQPPDVRTVAHPPTSVRLRASDVDGEHRDDDQIRPAFTT